MWTSLQQLVDELGLNSNPVNPEDIKKELQQRLQDLHPDKSGGEFQDEKQKRTYHQFESALEWVSNYPNNTLVPIDVVHEIARCAQSNNTIQNVASRSLIARDAKDYSKGRYLFPKLGSAFFASVACFFFAYSQDIANRMVLDRSYTEIDQLESEIITDKIQLQILEKANRLSKEAALPEDPVNSLDEGISKLIGELFYDKDKLDDRDNQIARSKSKINESEKQLRNLTFRQTFKIAIETSCLLLCFYSALLFILAWIFEKKIEESIDRCMAKSNSHEILLKAIIVSNSLIDSNPGRITKSQLVESIRISILDRDANTPVLFWHWPFRPLTIVLYPLLRPNIPIRLCEEIAELHIAELVSNGALKKVDSPGLTVMYDLHESLVSSIHN